MYITPDELRVYCERTGKRGLNLLKHVQSLQPVFEVLKTEEGREFLDYDIKRFESLNALIFDALINDKPVRDVDTAELRFLHGRLMSMSTRIDAYLKGMKKIKSGGLQLQ